MDNELKQQLLEKNEAESIRTLKLSYKNLIKNAKDGFNTHYLKIDNYKENLINSKIANKDTVFKVCFFMQDTSVMPIYFTFKGHKIDEINTFRLNQSKEFIEFFKDKTNVDFCFIGSKLNYKNILTLLVKDINNGKDVVNLDEIDMIECKPVCRAYAKQVILEEINPNITKK